MKADFDKEMDSLLRRGPGSMLWPGGVNAHAPAQEAAPHLDADELNAYAENALPAAARTAYTAHLADCDRCRGLIIKMSASADAAGQIEKSAMVAPVTTHGTESPLSAWLARLGALFSPRMLRYAVPILAVCIVGALTFVAVRSRRDESLSTPQTRTDEATRNGTIAQDEPASGTPSGATNSATPEQHGQIAQTPNPNAAPPSGVAPIITTGNGAGSSSASTGGTTGSVGEDAPSPPPPPRSSGPSGVETKEIPELAKAVPPPVAPAATAPSQGGDVAREMRNEPQKSMSPEPGRVKSSEDEIASESNAGRSAEMTSRATNGLSQMQSNQAPDDSRGNRRAANNVATGSAARAASAPAGESRALKRGRAPETTRDEDKTKDSSAKDDEETRGVGGHRFRRQGGAWVDVNYKPTMATTGVRRDTEGYRALIADIPELGRIAEQLGGEIIVVVKGRSYRIR